MSTVLAGLIGFPTFSTIVVLIPLAAGLAPLVIPSLILLIIVWWLNDGLTYLHRSRLASLIGLHIPAARRPGTHYSFVKGTLVRLKSGSTWRQLTYHTFVGLLNFVMANLLAVWVAMSILCATVFATTWSLSMAGLDRTPWVPEALAIRITVTVIGIVALILTPWLARAMACMDGILAIALLGPSRNRALSEKVETLSKSRAGVVDAADAERRRIERDLHDGTQQRLTSLAMNLGIAKATFKDLPMPARKALDDAHDEAKQALVELRMLVRGLHPAVLDDRGLDAALSGIVARSPIPIQLDVDLPVRPPRTIEAVAYFVISEALTNVIKHARANVVQVVVTSDGEWLSLRVTDDGVGGADNSKGSGLDGLRQRIDAVDGHLLVDSPVGGPTHILAELPCAS